MDNPFGFLWGDLDWDEQNAREFGGGKAWRDERDKNALRKMARFIMAAYGLGTGIQAAAGAGGGGAVGSGSEQSMGLGLENTNLGIQGAGGGQSMGLGLESTNLGVTGGGGQSMGLGLADSGVGAQYTSMPNYMSTGTGAGQQASTAATNLDTANKYMALANQAKGLTEGNPQRAQVGQPYSTGYDYQRDRERRQQRVSDVYGGALYGRGGGMYG